MQKFESDPNFLDHFGDNPEDLMLWMEEMKEVIQELEYKYQDQIYLHKSCTQSGFQKRKYPTFSGKVLDFYELKERWKEEVSGNEARSPRIKLSRINFQILLRTSSMR